MGMDVYYDPEKFGLTTIGEADFSSGSYEFDLFVVWQDNATGDLLWGQDSGCSCPSPFDFQGVGDLTRGTPHEAAAAIQARLAERDEYDIKYGYGETEAADLIAKIMALPASAGSRT